MRPVSASAIYPTRPLAVTAQQQQAQQQAQLPVHASAPHDDTQQRTTGCAERTAQAERRSAQRTRQGSKVLEATTPGDLPVLPGILKGTRRGHGYLPGEARHG